MSATFAKVLVVLSSIASLCVIDATNYCHLDKSICVNHIACNNTGKFGASCSPDRAVIKMNLNQQSRILKLHNQMRNKIALGEVKGYKPARRMPALQWSAELAYLAGLNARSCQYGHDECRSTDRYLFAGQNIARRGNTKDYEQVQEAMRHMITDWFTEYKDANMNYINAFRNPEDHKKKIGHFTVMVNDKNSRVGCALSRYQENGYKYLYLVCNYSFTNILDEPVYKVGAYTSGCKRGRHAIYKGLCSTEEIIQSIPG